MIGLGAAHIAPLAALRESDYLEAAMATPPTPGESVAFEVVREAWSAVRLIDDHGTEIELKPVIIDVRRTDQRDENGRPVYRLTAAVVARVPASVSNEGDE